MESAITGSLIVHIFMELIQTYIMIITSAYFC
jgi:hypothetical protein